MPIRHHLSWKPWFFDVLLPRLRRMEPSQGDAILARLGTTLAAWPPRRAELSRHIDRVNVALEAGWNTPSVRSELAANFTRFLARDYLLEGLSDPEFASRFDVEGLEHLQAARAEGRGAILLGSHMGAYLVGMHWLVRREVPLRLMVQTPSHVSPTLLSHFEHDVAPYPQIEFALRRGLPPSEAALRLMRARLALRDGICLYVNGDVAWPSGSTRPGRLIGHERSFLSAWADLAALTRTPVVPIFCAHLPGGRYRLTFEPAWRVETGNEPAAIARYLSRLEDEIRAHPSDAIPYLLWPSFHDPSGGRRARQAASPAARRSLLRADGQQARNQPAAATLTDPIAGPSRANPCQSVTPATASENV